MAVYGEGFSADGDRSASGNNLLQVLAAVTSLALMIAVIYWGYQLVVRDVSGIPVVRAVEGEMRAAPANPGGNVAQNAGLAVNAVLATGGAAPLEDTLLLAPESDGLAPEDLSAPVPVIAEEAPVEAPELVIESLLAEVVGISLPAEVELLPADVPGVARSIRPRSRPAFLGEQPAPEEIALSNTAFPVGTHLVQLGAFRSPTEAAAEWTRLQRLFGPVLSGKERVIEVSTQVSGTWYRLRAAGLEGRDDARRLCAALLAEETECVPLVVD